MWNFDCRKCLTHNSYSVCKDPKKLNFIYYVKLLVITTWYCAVIDTLSGPRVPHCCAKKSFIFCGTIEMKKSQTVCTRWSARVFSSPGRPCEARQRHAPSTYSCLFDNKLRDMEHVIRAYSMVTLHTTAVT